MGIIAGDFAWGVVAASGGGSGAVHNDGARVTTIFATGCVDAEEVAGVVAAGGDRTLATASALILAVAADVLEILTFSSILATRARTCSFESGSPPTGGKNSSGQ